MDRPPWTEHTGPVNSVALSSTGICVASCSSDKTVGLWDIKRGQNNVRRFRGHTEAVNSVAFSPDGKRVASCSHDKTIRLWDTEARETRGETQMTITEPAISVAFSSDGDRITFCFSNGTVREWDVKTGISFEAMCHPMEHNGKAIAFPPDGYHWAELLPTNQVLCWNRSPLALLPRLNGLSRCVALSKQHVAWDDDQSDIYICRLRRNVLKVPAEERFVLEVSAEEAVAKPWLGQRVAVDSLAFSSDGKYLVSGYSNGTIRLWNIETRQQVGSIMKGDQLYPMHSVAVSCDGHCVASGSRDGMIRLWRVQHQTDVCEWKGHANSIRSVAFSSNGAYLVSSSDDLTIRVWDLELVKGELSRRKDPKVPRCTMEEGWIIGPNGERLLWIHPLLRPGLLFFCDATVFPSFMTTKLDFSSFVHGESWSLCKGM
ncbi:WD40 repeat-like protein [Serendipita vermifera]|nr:WD40 repeat-like protein [Serendipita vermifera]